MMSLMSSARCIFFFRMRRHVLSNLEIGKHIPGNSRTCAYKYDELNMKMCIRLVFYDPWAKLKLIWWLISLRSFIRKIFTLWMHHSTYTYSQHVLLKKSIHPSTAQLSLVFNEKANDSINLYKSEKTHNECQRNRNQMPFRKPFTYNITFDY